MPPGNEKSRPGEEAAFQETIATKRSVRRPEATDVLVTKMLVQLRAAHRSLKNVTGLARSLSDSGADADDFQSAVAGLIDQLRMDCDHIDLIVSGGLASEVEAFLKDDAE